MPSRSSSSGPADGSRAMARMAGAGSLDGSSMWLQPRLVSPTQTPPSLMKPHWAIGHATGRPRVTVNHAKTDAWSSASMTTWSICRARASSVARLDGQARFLPRVEAAGQVGHVEAHVLEALGGQRASGAGTAVDDDPA